MSGSSVLLLVGAILVSTESSRALNFGDRCQTPKEEPGKCVTIPLCSAITQLLPPKDGNVLEVAKHQVRLGEYDTSTKIDCDGDECADPVRDVMIANVIVHADYFREGIAYYNDIALLELIEPVEFTDFVQPICLPIAPEVRQVNYTGMYMTIAGWGQTLHGGVSTRKQHLYVRLLSNETCVNAFRSLQIDIRPTQVCVDGGGNNLNACRSEAGGPLIRRGDGVSSYQYWYLIGLASFGVEQCRTDGMPVVYTRLTEHIDWLKDVMSGTI
uniref:Peptidase S1 domain-containing protein n=1 Tax=Anopheles dirus TaxID=7168 RepID=A0A182N3T8_9DIPT